MQINQEHMFEYSEVEWRFSGTPMTFFGLDPILLVAFPALFFGLAKQYGIGYFVLLGAFVGIVIYVGFATKHPSVMAWINALRTKYIQRCQWPTA